MDGMITLPPAFLRRMSRLLQEEYDDFLASYGQGRYYGMRCNLLKASCQEFVQKMPFRLEPVSWAGEGYYYQPEEQPGRHVLHEAGAYYIQEPSAMAVVEILDPQPGECVLDLCAAPGGKSTQIAGRMQGEGLLVSNEIILGRAKILSQNIERMGVRNCVVCNETPERMSAFFPAFFDRIVVDAPCSGEGMFRKDETAVTEWSEEHVAMCADRQYGILEETAGMLKPGGVLVYSTCTFAPDENEAVISRFVQEHEEYVVEDVPHDDAFVPGRPEWIENPAQGLEATMRLMPHRLKGEGHYIARLRRRGMSVGSPGTDIGAVSCEKSRKADRNEAGKHGRGRQNAGSRMEQTLRERVADFVTKELGLSADWLFGQQGKLLLFGEQIYLVPMRMPDMRGLKVVRPGLHLATDKKNRLEPAHALAMAAPAEENIRSAVELSEEEAARYQHGESLPCDGAQKGWIVLTHKGYPLGYGKAAGGQIKNHYPKGLRR